MKPDITETIFSINGDEVFTRCALEIFHFQYAGNKVYKEFIDNLNTDPRSVNSLKDIPFMPVDFFKTREVITGTSKPATIFESSGTTGHERAKHYITDTGLYERSFLETFRRFYGAPEEYFFAALLPSYTDRQNSSLVYMADHLVRKSRFKESGFFKDNAGQLLSSISSARQAGAKILLLGVSFALLDLAENHASDLHDVIIMETGGMKGRRKEITRDELHGILTKAFNVSSIHSEYGMTELLSQAYSKAGGLFHCPPWMKIVIRDPQDPKALLEKPGTTGGINIIDLANIHSCSFISTGDLGKLHADGSFEVLGRIDNSDIRGCNLLIE